MFDLAWQVNLLSSWSSHGIFRPFNRINASIKSILNFENIAKFTYTKPWHFDKISFIPRCLLSPILARGVEEYRRVVSIIWRKRVNIRWCGITSRTARNARPFSLPPWRIFALNQSCKIAYPSVSRKFKSFEIVLKISKLKKIAKFWNILANLQIQKKDRNIEIFLKIYKFRKKIKTMKFSWKSTNSEKKSKFWNFLENLQIQKKKIKISWKSTKSKKKIEIFLKIYKFREKHRNFQIFLQISKLKKKE